MCVYFYVFSDNVLMIRCTLQFHYKIARYQICLISSDLLQPIFVFFNSSSTQIFGLVNIPISQNLFDEPWINTHSTQASACVIRRPKYLQAIPIFYYL